MKKKAVFDNELCNLLSFDEKFVEEKENFSLEIILRLGGLCRIYFYFNGFLLKIYDFVGFQTR